MATQDVFPSGRHLCGVRLLVANLNGKSLQVARHERAIELQEHILCIMKKNALLIVVLFCYATAFGQQWTDSAWRADVKTVTLTRSGVELEAPVLEMQYENLGSNSTRERMLLQFDILADEAENLRYSLFHCDANWLRDDLEPYEFMRGLEDGEIENIEFSFSTLQSFVHYHQMIPAKGSSFIHSGNYIVVVTDGEGDTVLTRRFWVNEGNVRMEAEITKPYDGGDIMRKQEVDVVLTLPSPSQGGAGNGSVAWNPPTLRPEYERVLVQQNGRWDNARWLEFSGYEGRGLAYRYRQQNIFFGGNNYRYFDCSNLRSPMYNIVRIEEYGGEIFAMVRPEEDRSRKHYLNETTLNGGMKVNVWDRQNKALQADYVWVNISLPMAQPWLDKSVYVIGQLTDWRLDSTSRMDYVPEYKAYVKRLLLKQGYYSYLLLCTPSSFRGTPPMAGGEVSSSATATLEGDHWETPNSYTIYVYHREPSDRADRLVGLRRVQQ